MRVLIVAGATLAVVAFVGVAVLAVWPVVADAPWEDGSSKVEQQEAESEDRLRELRCESALRRLEAAEQGLGDLPGRYTMEPILKEQATNARYDIQRYC